MNTSQSHTFGSTPKCYHRVKSTQLFTLSLYAVALQCQFTKRPKNLFFFFLREHDSVHKTSSMKTRFAKSWSLRIQITCTDP